MNGVWEAITNPQIVAKFFQGAQVESTRTTWARNCVASHRTQRGVGREHHRRVGPSTSSRPHLAQPLRRPCYVLAVTIPSGSVIRYLLLTFTHPWRCEGWPTWAGPGDLSSLSLRRPGRYSASCGSSLMACDAGTPCGATDVTRRPGPGPDSGRSPDSGRGGACVVPVADDHGSDLTLAHAEARVAQPAREQRLVTGLFDVWTIVPT